jgi:uncharacterized membrane protein
MMDVLYLSNVKNSIYAPLLQAGDNYLAYVPAVLSWILIFFGVYYLAARDAESYSDALVKGMLFGFFSYGIYNMTNLATWGQLANSENVWRMALLNTIWGSMLSGGLSVALFTMQ